MIGPNASDLKQAIFVMLSARYEISRWLDNSQIYYIYTCPMLVFSRDNFVVLIHSHEPK